MVSNHGNNVREQFKALIFGWCLLFLICFLNNSNIVFICFIDFYLLILVFLCVLVSFWNLVYCFWFMFIDFSVFYNYICVNIYIYIYTQQLALNHQICFKSLEHCEKLLSRFLFDKLMTVHCWPTLFWYAYMLNMFYDFLCDISRITWE